MQLFFNWVEQEECYTLNTAGYCLFIAGIILLLLAVSFFSRRKEQKPLDAKQLAFCSMALALATVTSFIKVFSFPTGGSITLLSMFFVCYIGYLYGPKTGIICGVAFGILQLIIEPKIYFPMQIVIDYILAFGALGLSGFFRNKKWGLIVGYLVGIFGRFVFSTLSGVIFFSEYAWEGWNPILYSAVYNGIYIFSEGLVTVILLFVPAVSSQLKRIQITTEASH